MTVRDHVSLPNIIILCLNYILVFSVFWDDWILGYGLLRKLCSCWGFFSRLHSVGYYEGYSASKELEAIFLQEGLISDTFGLFWVHTSAYNHKLCLFFTCKTSNAVINELASTWISGLLFRAVMSSSYTKYLCIIPVFHPTI